MCILKETENQSSPSNFIKLFYVCPRKKKMNPLFFQNGKVKLQISFKINLFFKKKVKVLVTESCPSLCDPMTYSLPGSSIHRILQARVLGYIAFTRGSFQLRDQTWDLLHGRQILTI